MTINSSYITLHLTAWKSSSCPINSFIIQYKQQGSNEWLLASGSVSATLDSYTLADLYPGSWYNLLIGGHSDAGSTEAEYLFATLTEAGATVSPLSASASADLDSAGLRFRRYVQMFLPVISIFVAFVVLLAVLLLLSFRRGNAGSGRHMSGMHHFSECLGLQSVTDLRPSIHFSRLLPSSLTPSLSFVLSSSRLAVYI